MNIESIVNTILGVVWSPYLVVLCLLAGLYFSVRTLHPVACIAGHAAPDVPP